MPGGGDVDATAHGSVARGTAEVCGRQGDGLAEDIAGAVSQPAGRHCQFLNHSSEDPGAASVTDALRGDARERQGRERDSDLRRAHGLWMSQVSLRGWVLQPCRGRWHREN